MEKEKRRIRGRTGSRISKGKKDRENGREGIK
jgi:hypothetical protein